ncbi:MAG: peptidoglycan editing factor PgeF [bacterium]|nr:peptidoglycan editing factor PgeF [bacterium]
MKFQQEGTFHGGFGGIGHEPPSDLLLLKQIHGDKIYSLTRREEVAQFRGNQGDAILSCIPGQPVGVRMADCVPILIAHPSGWVGAVHAGWRGTAKRILAKTLKKLSQEISENLADAILAIGPAISGENYEVGAEVAEAFSESGSEWLRSKGNKFLLDLKGINRQQAIEAGVPESHIRVFPQCTFSDPAFFSYRRAQLWNEDREGRNYAWVMREPLK